MNIRRKKRRQVPGLNMASMPDLIFTVLFFFMIVTHMRNETVQVKYEVPQGTEVGKPAKKFSTMNVYIGQDSQGAFRIQVNDKVCDISQVSVLVQRFCTSLPLEEQDDMTVNIRADKGTPMGLVNDLKTELRKAGVTSVRYSATESSEELMHEK